jgi:hypothetical protein
MTILALLLGRAAIAALILLGIFAALKLINDASKKGTTNVR